MTTTHHPVRPFVLLALASLLSSVTLASSAWAVVVFPKNGEPVMGFLVHEDEVSIKVEQVLPNGTRQLREFLRSEIDNLYITVSTRRLESLTVTEPKAYRDYAEELREKRQDPEARAAAIRLYVIAAYLEPEELGRSCLLGLIELARSEQEERKFRAMAYLLDPKHDERVLQRQNPVATSPARATSKSKPELLAAIRSLRQGNYQAAARALARPQVQAALAPYQAVISLEELQKASRTANVPLTTLTNLLTLELSLMPGTSRVLRPRSQATTPSWRHGIQRDGLSPVPSLTLETLTEFDPRQAEYRDGKWTGPQ